MSNILRRRVRWIAGATAGALAVTLAPTAAATGTAAPVERAAATPAMPAAAGHFSENFDSLSAALQPRVDETGVPATTLGFTHTAPSGWSVTTSPTVSDRGVTEWRGWSFTTPAFWTATAPGQGRENFTRAQGVFAVADDDEWDDRNSPTDTAIFDSVLTSPAVDVTGRKSVNINYDSSYRQTGPQRATLRVSFDGGPSQELFVYSTTTLGDQVYLENRSVTQPVAVPAGATSMKVSWAVEQAQNDWYWAIDSIDITDSPRPGAEAPMPHIPGPADLPNGVSKRKVLFIDLDGVRYDKLLEAETPIIASLAAGGQFGPSYLHDNAIAGTNSGPGHSSMLSGVWPDKHHVLDNSFGNNDLAEYPDVFTRLETARPAFSTFTTLDWTPLNQFLFRQPDVKMQQIGASTQITDRASTKAAVQALSQHNPDALFVYQHSGDNTGHSIGDQSPEYISAIETMDANIGQMVQAIRSRATYRSENWLILIGTDHGFAGTGHGGDQHSTRTGWLLANGGDVPQFDGQAREWRQPDVAATILKQLRVPIDPAWGLDGIPIGTASTDPFDTVTPTRGVVDEPAKPPFSGGWSPRLPAGWTRPATTKDGTTEFRGWQLMTGEFWATSGEGAGRGSFVRGRDTIAVADQALWNSTGAPASAGRTFSSTLNSPWQVVRKNKLVTVTYQSHLRQPVGTGGRAELIAEFDNGTHQVLWASDAKDGAAAQISVPVTVNATAPAGARQVRIGWKLSGGTDGYWAIDAPQIRT